MSDEKLAYEIEVNLPNLPKGEPVQIPGLGTFENGNTYDVTQEEADSYRSFHTVAGERGQTLLAASKNMYGVEVATYGKQKSSSDGENTEGGDNE